jgi:hypothetical protein
MECDAGRELASVFREQQAAFRWSVVAGEFRELFIEILETEAEAKGLRVFQK